MEIAITEIEKEKMTEKFKALLFGSIILSLTACASTNADYDSVIDGPKDAAYKSDLKACKKSADEWYYAEVYASDEDDEAPISGAALGAALGAAIGPGFGAALGATIDSQNDAYTAEEYSAIEAQYDEIVIGCMKERGYRITDA